MGESDKGLDRRRQQRKTVFVHDCLTIHARSAKGEYIVLRIVDLNSFGALVVPPQSVRDDLEPGCRLMNVSIYYNQFNIGHYSAGEIRHARVSSSEQQLLFGVMFLGTSLESVRQKEKEQRIFPRIEIQEEKKPHAWVSHPFLYDDFVYFEVQNISAKGAGLVCSKRNSLLLRGAVIENLQLLLPTVGLAVVCAKIVEIREHSNSGRMAIGVEFLSISPEVKIDIARYLMVFGKSSGPDLLQEIRTAGFRPKRVRSHVDFACVTTIDEFQQVLSLRKEAYSRVGKISKEIPELDMSDRFDLNSIVVVAKCRGRVVGSVRMTFCKNSMEQFELEESITIPPKFKKSITAEISRLCVSKEFQNTDLALGLIERCTELAAKHGIRYAISSCVHDMLGYYKKLGFFSTGLKFELKTLNGIPHYFIVHDVRSHWFAYKVSPIYWYYAYQNVVTYLRKFGFIRGRRLGIGKRLLLFLQLNFLRIVNKKSKGGRVLSN